MNAENNKNKVVVSITNMRYFLIILQLDFVFQLETILFIYWPYCMFAQFFYCSKSLVQNTIWGDLASQLYNY